MWNITVEFYFNNWKYLEIHKYGKNIVKEWIDKSTDHFSQAGELWKCSKVTDAKFHSEVGKIQDFFNFRLFMEFFI